MTQHNEYFPKLKNHQINAKTKPYSNIRTNLIGEIFIIFWLGLAIISSILFVLFAPSFHVETRPPIELNNGARLEWVPCWFEQVDTQHQAECAYFYPEDSAIHVYASAIRLPLVILKNPQARKRLGPLLYLAGGPGGSSYLDKSGILFWWTWLESNGLEHDLVLFDQRGAGMSSPSLTCPELHPITRTILTKKMSLNEEQVLWQNAYIACHQRLQQSGLNLSVYNSKRSSQDVAEIIQLLNTSNLSTETDKWNLLGISYGTRLALEVIRQYPQYIRSVILDSVYPQEMDGLLGVPSSIENALETLFSGCKVDARCNEHFPHLDQVFDRLVARLNAEPLYLEVVDPESQKILNVLLTGNRLLEVIFNAMYRWDLIEQIPASLNAIETGDLNIFQPLLNAYVENLLDTTFSDGMYLSVECHDSNASISREEYLAEVAKFPRVQAFVKSLWDENPCKIWDSGHADKSFHEPVKSNIPTLFLSGKYDPVTPSFWAHDTARYFSDAYLLLFPSVGHGVFDSDVCAATITQQFLRDPYNRPMDPCLGYRRDPDFMVQLDDMYLIYE